MSDNATRIETALRRLGFQARVMGEPRTDVTAAIAALERATAELDASGENGFDAFMSSFGGLTVTAHPPRVLQATVDGGVMLSGACPSCGGGLKAPCFCGLGR